MKRFQTLILITALSSFVPFASAAERWETLHAINMVENPTNQTAYGSRGELGPYQFRASTWQKYSKKPFRLANERAAADEVAVQHYEWIKERLASAGIDPNTYNIALAWNCGISAVINGRVPTQTYNYAERVNNLAETYHQAEESLPVVSTVEPAPATPAGGLEFKIGDQSEMPQFKITTNAPRFVLEGESPHFLITPTLPRFLLAVN